MAESKNKSFYADIEQGSQAIDHYIDNMPENEFCALCLVDLDDFKKPGGTGIPSRSPFRPTDG